MFDNAFVFVFNGKLSQKAISGTKLSQNQGMPKCKENLMSWNKSDMQEG
jgi:hypothetical protein